MRADLCCGKNWGPPPHWDTIVGHPCEGWIFTGQLPSGLAMHDIDPSMYEGAARYFFEGLLPVRQLAYPAHKHYEGSHYTYARYEHEIASAMIWNAIGLPDVFPASQPAVMSDFIYALLPNGTMVAYGDCEISPGETLQDEKAMCMSMASALYAGRTPPDGETVLPEHLRWVVDHPPVPGATGPGNWGSDYRSGLVSVINFIHIPSDSESFWPTLHVCFCCASPCTAIRLKCDLLPVAAAAPNSTDIATLPTSRYFPDPMGEMVVRTGWDLNATSTDTIVALRIGGIFFGNHQRRDAGSFQIFYRSALAMSSGHYGSYGTPHWKNYYHSSISVNSLLIFDPSEGTENVNGNAGVNVGGQRMPIHDQPSDLATLMAPENKYRIGRVVAQGWEEVGGSTVPRWNWLSGDITDAYCSNKTKHVSRSYLVWTWPGDTVSTAVVIFDRVHSTDPVFAKTFLMHTLNKPVVRTTATATAFDIIAGDGALSGTMLLPTSASVQTVGGPGNEFEAGGQNWPPTNADKATGVSGQWRLEVSPKQKQQNDLFLSVWQPHDAIGSTPAAASLVSWPGDAVVGVQVRERIAVFVAGANGLANVTSLDLRGGRGIVWSGGSTVSLHACGLKGGTWMTGDKKTLGQASAPSFCLVANVTKLAMEAGPLHVSGAV